MVYENINRLIKEKGWTKREFAQRLISLDATSKRTGERLGEKAIYAYLNGRSAIHVDLIPAIAEALQVSEQQLFERSPRIRQQLLNNLLQEPLTKEEQELICEACLKDLPETYQNVFELLPYASETVLTRFIETLSKLKEVGKGF